MGGAIRRKFKITVLLGGLIVFALLAWSRGVWQETSAAAPSIQLSRDARRIEVLGLDRRALARLAASTLDTVAWNELFEIYPGESMPASDSGMPAMLGSYRVEDERIVFTPRFPLVDGLSYTARFNTEQLAEKYGAPAGRAISATFSLPAAAAGAPTRVAAIYPSADLLPANQLKLYLHFSAPMSFGEAADRIHLYDEAGREVPRAWLRVDQELWDPARERFTLLFDPGRIKRGLRSNREDGAPLVEGKKYRLVIDRAWRDGNGHPLASDGEKLFTVTAPDRTAPDLRAWRVTAPAPGSNAPLRVVFDESLDYALLGRMIEIYDERGARVGGKIEIANNETEWRLVPAAPWLAGHYEVRLNPLLEDRAGNNLRRLYDADLRTDKTTDMPEHIILKFEIAAVQP
jgi:hypothetical protein